jgi:hypothetical protein
MSIRPDPTSRPPRRDTDRLRDGIDPGRTRDKIPHLHRTIVPLGTGDEASASRRERRLGPAARFSAAMIGYALFVRLFGIFFWSALIR